MIPGGVLQAIWHWPRINGLISRVIATADVTSRLIDFVTETLLLVLLVLGAGYPVALAARSPAIDTSCDLSRSISR